MEYIRSFLPQLMAVPSPTGFTRKAAELVMEELKKMGFAPEMTRKGCVFCTLGGEGDPLVLSAHIDTLGAMVAEVKPNGRLRLSPLGGLNPNNAEAENFFIFPRLSDKVYTGVFQMNDPSVHVNGDYSSEKRTFDTMELIPDELTFSKEETEALGIAVGDVVAPDPRTVITPSGYVKSRFLDDKLSVVILLALAKRIAEGKLALRRKVSIFVTVYEEVGHGCSAGIPEETTDIISVDMGCVGSLCTCLETQVSICAKDSHGPSDYDLTTELIKSAKENAIDYAVDIYPHYGSDADAALGAGYDIRHCVVGSGVYASHGYERTHMKGIEATLELLSAYVKA